jgi:hypothetical protein
VHRYVWPFCIVNLICKVPTLASLQHYVCMRAHTHNVEAYTLLGAEHHSRAWGKAECKKKRIRSGDSFQGDENLNRKT